MCIYQVKSWNLRLMKILVVPERTRANSWVKNQGREKNYLTKNLSYKPTMSGISCFEIYLLRNFYIIHWQESKINTMINFKPSTSCEGYQKHVKVLKWSKKQFWWLHPPIQLFPFILCPCKKILKHSLESKGRFLSFS